MKYIVHNNFSRENNQYNWEQGCHYCKNPFQFDEKFKRVDVQITYMRGDDEVYSFHNECYERGMEQLRQEYK